MKNTDNNMINFRDDVPEGFFIEPDGGKAFIIRYKRTGMTGLNVFLIFFLIGWSVGFFFMLKFFLDGRLTEDGEPIPLWVILLFLALEAWFIWLVIGLLFNKKTFRLNQDNLIIENNVLGFKRKNVIPKSSIIRLLQVKDGGGEDDSFPSWGLRIECPKYTPIISRQPYEKCQWLGKVLAQWAGVEFVQMPEQRS